MHILATTSDCKHCKKFIIVRTMEAQIQVSLLLLPDWIQSNLCSFLLKVAKKLSENLCLWPSPVQITQNCCASCECLFRKVLLLQVPPGFWQMFLLLRAICWTNWWYQGPIHKKDQCFHLTICPIVTRAATTRFSLQIWFSDSGRKTSLDTF